MDQSRTLVFLGHPQLQTQALESLESLEGQVAQTQADVVLWNHYDGELWQKPHEFCWQLEMDLEEKLEVDLEEKLEVVMQWGT